MLRVPYRLRAKVLFPCTSAFRSRAEARGESFRCLSERTSLPAVCTGRVGTGDDAGAGVCIAGERACWDSPSQPEEPASRRRAMAKGQVQRRYLDRDESTSLRAMLPPVGGTDWVSAASRASASPSLGEPRVCGRLLHRVWRRTLLLNWSLRGQGPAPVGMPHQSCLVKEREKVFVNPGFVRSSPSLSIYAICVGIVPCCVDWV